MLIPVWVIVWFAIGGIGVCIITYLDDKQECSNGNTAVEHLAVSCLGVVPFLYSLFCIWHYMKHK